MTSRVRCPNHSRKEGFSHGKNERCNPGPPRPETGAAAAGPRGPSRTHQGAIWANTTEQGVRYGVTLSRIYKDQESGEWRNSTSFGRDDLLLVGKVCELALLWVYEQTQTQGPNQTPDGEDIPF